MPFDGATCEREDLLDAWERQERILAARANPNDFVEYTTKGDGGEYITQEAGHREWQDIWSRYEKSVILGPVGTGKTTQLRKRLIWEIGHDPEDTRIAYVSNTQQHPKKQLGSLKEEITGNPRIWHVFPHLRPSEGDREVWSSTEILVQRNATHPDTTLTCYGLYGPILGSRKTIIVFDDLCTFANTLTAASREKMADWLAEVLSRLKGKVKVWAIGHIWHEEDALQMLARRPGWYYARYQATRADAEGRQVPCFPNILPPAKIRDHVDQLGPVYSRMMLYNELPPVTTSRFRDSWFHTCLKLGKGLGFAKEWPADLGRVICGVDLGHKKKAGSDYTAMVTAVVLPSGLRRILDVRFGRWKADEIVGHLEALRELYDPQFFVEDNGGQSLFNELLLDIAALPVTGEWTSRDKYHHQNGIEGLGHELRAGLWMLPCDENLVPLPGVAEMIKGAKGYDPNKHPADLLMAWWICRKGILKGAALQRRALMRDAAGDVPVD